MSKTTKRPTYLVETSAVQPAIGGSTPKHNEHFRRSTADGTLATSIYIRKEYIDRWFLDLVRVATTIAMCDTVAHALVVLEQSFKPRDVKGVLHALSSMLTAQGSVGNTRAAAEEAASAAVIYLRTFDKTFTTRTSNRCGCEIGGLELNVDYNRLLNDLAAFANKFRQTVEDCQVNRLMRVDKHNGLSKQMVDDESLSDVVAVQQLGKIRAKSKHINCKNCRTIGDAVIAADQPKSVSLVHLDGAFVPLCGMMETDRLGLKSVTAAEADPTPLPLPLSPRH